MLRKLNKNELEMVSGGSRLNPEDFGPYPVGADGHGGPTGHPNGGVDGPTGDDAFTTLED